MMVSAPTLGVDAYMERASDAGVPPDRAAAVLMLCLVKTIHTTLEQSFYRELADQALLESVHEANRLLQAMAWMSAHDGA